MERLRQVTSQNNVFVVAIDDIESASCPVWSNVAPTISSDLDGV